MKSKLLNLGLIVTSFAGYLEWGEGNQTFLIQAEIEVISKLINDPSSVLHPLTLLPLAGQIFLFITLFQKTPGRLLTFLGLSGIGLLLIFMFIIGVISLNIKIILSTLPFLLTGFFTLKHQRAIKSDAKK